MNKRDLSERDICTKYITPALVDHGGWDLHSKTSTFNGDAPSVVLCGGRYVRKFACGKLMEKWAFKAPLFFIEIQDRWNAKNAIKYF